MTQILNRYLTRDEEAQLFRCLRGRAGLIARRDLAWMKLLRASGMRVGTLAGFTCGDARIALRTDHLVFRDAICKGKRGYTIFATKRAKAALRELLKIRREMGHAERDEALLVMSRQQGKGISRRSLQDRCRFWQAEAGLAVPFSPHWFRHTVGQRITRDSTASDPRAIAQQVLGHGSIESTTIYTRPSREDVAGAMAEVC